MEFVVGNELQRIPLDSSPTDINLSNDGKYLAVAIRQGKPCIRLFTTKDGKCVGEFGQGAWTGFGVAFVEGGKSLCYLTWDKEQTATLWKVQIPSGKPEKLKSLVGESDCKLLDRDEDGTMVAVGGGAVRVIDLKSEKRVFRVVCNVPGAEGVAHFADAKRIWVGGSESARLVLYDIASGKQLKNLEGPAPHCLQVVGSNDGRWLVGVGGGGHGAALYSLEKNERIETDSEESIPFSDRRKFTGAFAFSHDSKLALILTGLTLSMTLPKLELNFSDEEICEAGNLAVQSATARDAPLVAFAFHRGENVVLVPTKPKK